MRRYVSNLTASWEAAATAMQQRTLHRDTFVAADLGRPPGLFDSTVLTAPLHGADITCSRAVEHRGGPRLPVDGFNRDEPYIPRRRTLEEADDVDDRVTFAVRDAADPQLEGLTTQRSSSRRRTTWHARSALRAARRLLTDDGVVFIGDARAAERFSAPGDVIERLLFGFSVLHCLPNRPPHRDTVGRHRHGDAARHGLPHATEAGFSSSEVMPVDHHLWRSYLLA